MSTNLITEILAFLFGRKYYANIINTKGTDRHEVCSYIFHTREEADRHRDSLASTMSFRYVETISFRSREAY